MSLTFDLGFIEIRAIVQDRVITTYVRRENVMCSILINLFIARAVFAFLRFIIRLISRRIIKVEISYAGKLNNTNIVYARVHTYIHVRRYTHIYRCNTHSQHQRAAHTAITHETAIGRFPGNRRSPASS